MPASHGLSLSHHPHGVALPHAGPLTHHDKLVKNAQKLVSQSFFGTILKQMHNSPFKSEVFSGGRGGEAFGSMLDQRLAERMASGAAGKLVDSMVRRWEHTPATRSRQPAVKQSPQQINVQRSGYRKAPAGISPTAPAAQWRPYVPANIRA